MYKDEKRKKVKQLYKKGIWNIEYAIIPSFVEKENFFTKNEYKLYICLKEIFKKSKIDIFYQVALNQIVTINTKRNAKNLYKNYCDRSIDFVLYNNEEYKIKCCIELNDITHENENRKERDIFLKEVFEYTNIPLIFIKSMEFYEPKEIEKIILKEEIEKDIKIKEFEKDI